MTTIEETTIIEAPIERCFYLSLDIDLELRAGSKFRIKAISGVMQGVIGYGERVTWKTYQFGLPVTHTTEITGFNAPVYFEDSMVHGIFQSFRHKHFFRSLSPCRTEMRDELHFGMPWMLMGQISERLFVRERLKELLKKRNMLIKCEAELTAPKENVVRRIFDC